jgi:tetratricopeptide (TPR) repeat protein
VANCLIALKRYEAAVTQYGEIVTFFKNSAPQAYLRMGNCLLDCMKKKAEAIEIYRRICRQYKGSGESSAAHQRLEDLGIVVTEGGQEK